MSRFISEDKDNAVLVLRDAIFFDDFIFIKKNGENLKLTKEDIEFIDYNKPTFLHWLIAATSRAYLTPGYLKIEAKIKIKGDLKRRVYYIKIKYKEIFKLPAKFQPIGWCE